MPIQIQHRRSSTASKRPTAVNLLEGEIGVNLNDGTPGLYIEDSTGGVRKIGPAEVGGTAPNSSPAAGGATGNSVGEMWYDTTDSVLKIYTGASFVVPGTTTIGTTDIDLGSSSTTLAGLTSVSSSLVTFPGSTSGNFSLQSSAASDSTTYTWPAADGTSTQVLSTNGSGVLSWAEARTNDITQLDSSVVVTDTGTDGNIAFTVDGTNVWNIDSNGDLLPGSDFLYDLGSQSNRLGEVWALDVNVTSHVDLLGTASARFYDLDDSNYVEFKAPDVVGANVTYVWPAADGTNTQVLQTDGSGNLTWAEARTNDITDGDTSVTADGTADTITFEVNGADAWVMDADGDFIPQSGSIDIGTNTDRVDNLYVNNLTATNITGAWSGDIVASDLGGTGVDNSAAQDGQILIASANGANDATFDSAFLVDGQSLTATFSAGGITLDADLATAAAASGAANAGVASFDSTQFSVDGNGFVNLDLVATEDGGTGVDGSSAANGTVLIGNGSGYTLTTLSEGEGVDITNASGSITIAGEDATAGAGSGNKGIASYESSDFSLASGHVTLAGTVPQSVTTDGTAATPTNSAFAILGGTGLTSSGNAADVTLTLDDTAVTAAAYGADDTVGTFTVDAQGRLTAAADVLIDIAHTQVNDFDAGVQTNTLDSMAAPVASVDFNGQLLTGLADPVNDQDAATKIYVDSTAQGLDTKASCVVATTAELNGTYNNGTSGVGATLTNAGANAALTIDGVALSVGNRVLVKNQSDNGVNTSPENGIYQVTTVGDGSTAWVLTRTTDMDATSEMSGAYTFIESGTTNAANGYVQTETVSTVGTDDIVFEQFSGAGQVIAGDGLVKSGNTIDAVGTADRITVNANDIDIASTYVGQTSITTLGTVTTGTWNADIVGLSYGGTGVDNTNIAQNAVLAGPNTGGAGNAAFRELLTSDIAPVTGGSFDGGSF